MGETDDTAEGAQARRKRSIRGLVAAPLVLALVLVVLGGCASALQPPVLVEAGRLVYPAAAKAQGVEGEVVVQYDVNPDGTVTAVAVLSADPPGVFDAAATALVRSFRFRPARLEGRVVASLEQTSTVRFKLDDSAYEGY